jgi:hypothetical protein
MPFSGGSGHQPLFSETEETVFTDDDMVMDEDVQYLRRFLDGLHHQYFVYLTAL